MKTNWAGVRGRKRGRGDLLVGVGTEWEPSRGQPARRSLRVGRLRESARVERKARGTPARAEAPCTGGPRAKEEQSGDNGRGQRSGPETVQLELRRGPPRSPGSG